MADAPKPSTSLIALRDRREAVIQLLADSFAADLLGIDDARIGRAHAATSIAELDALVADVEPRAPAPSTALVPLAVEPTLAPTRRRIRSIFGNLESHGDATVADPERPLLRIRGPIIFGNVEMQTRLPGESERDARRRRKREKKAVPALPPRPTGS